jgi:hypothetical protein
MVMRLPDRLPDAEFWKPWNLEHWIGENERYCRAIDVIRGDTPQP